MDRGLAHRTQLKRWSSFGAALLLVALVLTTLTPSVVASRAHAIDPADTATDTEAAVPRASLTVAPQSPTIGLTAESFQFRAVLRNLDDAVLAGGQLTLSLQQHDQRVAAETAPDDAEFDVELIAEFDVSETPVGEDQFFEVEVARGDLPLGVPREPGVYLLHAEYISGDDTGSRLTTQTMFVWGPVSAPTALPVTLIVPLVLPASVRGVPSREELAAVAPALLRLLTAAEASSATVAVDPRILVGTRALGTAAPGAAQDLVERLESTQTPVFLLQVADADPAVQAALGFEELLDPLGFDYITQLGEFSEVPPETADSDALPGDDPAPGEAEAESAEPEAPGDEPANPTDDPDESSLTPTLDSLMSLPNARRAAWPAGGEVDHATLALLARSDLTTVVLDSTNVRDASATRVAIGDFDTFISAHDLGEAAKLALSGATLTERTAGLANLASLLAIEAQAGENGAIIALDRGAMAEVSDPAQVFDLIESLNWVQTVPEHEQPQGSASLRSGAPLEQRRELLRATLLRSAQIDDLAPLLEDPEYLTQYQRVRVLEALATRYAAPDVDFTEIDARSKLRDEQLLEGVQPVVTDSTQLVGTSSRVPVRLTNTLPFSAQVSLQATATSATIRLEERQFEATVPATGNTSVLVPVRSRVSSGDAGILLEVRDAAAEQVFATGRQPLVLRTSIETIMLSVLGAAAGLLLVFGVWRSVRRRRTRDGFAASVE